MHLVAHGAQVAIAAAVYDQRFVSPAEQMSNQFVPPVEAAGVRAQELLHAGDEVRERCFEHQMKMIFHEAVGMYLPLGLGADLSQSL